MFVAVVVVGVVGSGIIGTRTVGIIRTVESEHSEHPAQNVSQVHLTAHSRDGSAQKSRQVSTVVVTTISGATVVTAIPEATVGSVSTGVS